MNILSGSAYACLGALCVAVVAAGSPARDAQAGSIKTLYNFSSQKGPGILPGSGLTPGPDNALYGATLNEVYKLKQNTEGNWVVTPIAATAGVRSILGTAHLVYAASSNGGADHYGEIVELSPPTKGQSTWTATTIHTFTGEADGVYPVGIAFDANGNVVGQTEAGGGSFDCGSDNGVPTGCGTVFQLSQSVGVWSEAILNVWAGAQKGIIPMAGPSFDGAGNIYVSTQQSGGSGGAAGRTGCYGAGVQDIAEPSGTGYGPFTEIYRDNCQSPKAPQYPDDVIFPITIPAEAPGGTAANGAIITSSGGGNSMLCSSLDNNGCGTVGLLTEVKAGAPWKYTNLHIFTGPDGALPAGELLQVGADTIYGVAQGGGKQCSQSGFGCGSIYQLTLKNNHWVWGGVVFKFTGKDGGQPEPFLVDFNGTILGTTYVGGKQGGGTLFELIP